MTIASMSQQCSIVRAMARTIERSAATVSRELARNGFPEIGYASVAAHALSAARCKAARPHATPHPQGVASRVVLTLLDWK